MKSKFTLMLVALSLVASAHSAQAKKAETGGGQEVVVEVRKSTDKVEVQLFGKQPLRKVSMRWLQNPRRLRMTIPSAHLAHKAGRIAIDKGILQWAEAQDSADGVVIELATLSNPRSKVSLGADPRSLNWVSSCNEIAKGDELPAVAPGLASGGPETASPSHSERTVKTTASRPAETPAPRPTEPRPKATPKVDPKIATSKASPPVKEVPRETASKVTPPVAPSGPKEVKPADRLVSVSANGDLRSALEGLAKAAGLTAEIDAGVQGSVTMSFQDVPLNKAVSSILGQQSTFYEYRITDKVLKVVSPDGAGGKTVAPVASTSPRGTASEFFPIKDKKASEIVEAVRKAVPSLTYTVDERLNQILAEGEPSELERLRKLLQKVSVK